MPREIIPKPGGQWPIKKNMNQLDPICDACDSRAVIRDRDGLWCGRCALRRTTQHNPDDEQTKTIESGSRLKTPRIGQDTRNQLDNGKTDKPWQTADRPTP